MVLFESTISVWRRISGEESRRRISSYCSNRLNVRVNTYHVTPLRPITALTWALEVADPHRFSSVADAVSYCGLTAAFRSSAGKQQRGPISKQRNAWLQTALIEAAKLAPRWNPQLAALHAQQRERGHANRATLQVARRLVAYLLAVNKNGQPFQVRTRLRRQKQSRERENSQQLWRSRLREKTRPVRGYWSFLRHADLSPDDHSQLVNTKGNPPKRIPLVTHRSDESGPVGALQQSLLPFPRPTQATKVLMFNLSAIHRPVLAYFVAVHGGFGSQYISPSVSRPAGLL